MMSASHNVLTEHFFSEEISSQNFCSLKKLLYVFLLLRCENSLYVLGTSLIIYDLQIFSPFLWAILLVSL